MVGLCEYRSPGNLWPDECYWKRALEPDFLMRRCAEGWIRGFGIPAGLEELRCGLPPAPMRFEDRADATVIEEVVEVVPDPPSASESVMDSDDEIFCTSSPAVPRRRTCAARASSGFRQADRILGLPPVSTLLSAPDLGLAGMRGESFVARSGAVPPPGECRGWEHLQD